MSDPITIALLSLLAISAVSIVVFWPKILEWAEKNVFPWFERHLPTVAPYVRQAFSRVDNVVTAARRVIKQAWEKVSPYLLKQVLELSRQTSNIWVQLVTSWVVEMIETSGNKQSVFKEIRTEQEVPWDDLPQEVRENLLRRNQTSYTRDISQIRREEMALIH